MFDIYEKEIHSAFAGTGTESIIVEDGVIIGHTRGWQDPSVQDDHFKPTLIGKPVRKRGKGWHKMRGFRLEMAQAWALDVIE